MPGAEDVRARMNDMLHRAKVLIASALCQPPVGRLLGQLLRDRIPNRGCVIDVADPAVSASIKARLFFGFYESAEIRFVQRYLPRNIDVVELGASLGGVSAQIARKLEPGRRLVCVEANAVLLPLLELNVRANAKGVDLMVLHGAIDYASSAETVAFMKAEQNIDSRLAREGEESRSVSVPRIDLSWLLEHHRIGDYVLVSDVEGAEAGLIQCDKPALARCRLIIAELHATRFKGGDLGVDDLVRGLEERGFAVVDRRGPVCVFAPVTGDQTT